MNVSGNLGAPIIDIFVCPVIGYNLDRFDIVLGCTNNNVNSKQSYSSYKGKHQVLTKALPHTMLVPSSIAPCTTRRRTMYVQLWKPVHNKKPQTK